MAAQRLRCSWQALYNSMDRYPSVRAAVDDEKEQLGDLAETRLYQAINANMAKASFTYLRS